MKLLVKKTYEGLKPCYDKDYEIYSNIKINEEFEIDYKKKRNSKFHRKFFALLKLFYENQDVYYNIEDLRLDLIKESGRFEEVINIFTGEVFKKANSISFASMDEITFSELYEDCKTIICKHLGICKELIEEEIHQYY
jgi:hypothetical protein